MDSQIVGFLAVVVLSALVVVGVLWWWWNSVTKAMNASRNSVYSDLQAPSLRVKPETLPHRRSTGAPVFASYSRIDADLVRQILGLFRATDLPVFRDEESIKPGRKWRIAINAALEECQTILVFWCSHAAQSSEVQNEYERAISLDRRVVPVLMDNAALPTNLGQYQGVDLRMVFWQSHQNLIYFLREEEKKNRQKDVALHSRLEKQIPFERERDAEQMWEEYQQSESKYSVIRQASQNLESSLDSIL